MHKIYDEFQDERYLAMKGFLLYGGHFCKALGQALAYADHTNANKIKKAFPEMWRRHIEFYKKHLEKIGLINNETE